MQQRSPVRTILGLALALSAFGCASGPPPPGYPLYSNGGARRPQSEVASVYGPIQSIDGQDVSQHGSAFDLLPGCHIVALATDVVEHTHEIEIRGTARPVVFALAMKPGHRYFLRRELVQTAGNYGLLIDGKEEDPAGNVIGEYGPATDPQQLEACQKAAGDQ
jgi:hypothetical protein